MQYLKHIYHLFFPKICACCDEVLVEGENEVCLSCIVDLPFTNFSEEENNPMEQLFYGRVPIVFACALLYYQTQGKTQKIIYALKYQGQQQLGKVLSVWMFSRLKLARRTPRFDLIVPVPLHHTKLKKRGYNQLTTFGKSLSKFLEIPFNDSCLQRKKPSTTQTNKKRVERITNLDDIFTAVNIKSLDSKHVLLIDDVITTGATLEACVLALQNANVKISIITMAFTE